MADQLQHTLKNAISCTGIGLHSGLKVNMTLHPAAPDSGIQFRRTDLAADDCTVRARWDLVTDTTLCTTIGNAAGVKVATVEHLVAALAGCAIDNVMVELNGPEVPIMDGSSAPFVFLIDCAGRVEQPVPRRTIRVLKPVEIIEDNRSAVLLPSDGFSVAFEISFDSAAISTTTGFYDLHNGGFRRDICRARTFGFERDVDQLIELGFARGGSLDNVVVIGRDDEILNEGGLRYGDEFVRHKILDTVGDLYLAGAPLLAHFEGQRSGHQLNNELLRALFSDPTAWEYSYEAAKPVTAATAKMRRRVEGEPLRASA